jgi:hypothetical protein
VVQEDRVDGKVFIRAIREIRGSIALAAALPRWAIRGEKSCRQCLILTDSTAKKTSDIHSLRAFHLLVNWSCKSASALRPCGFAALR